MVSEKRPVTLISSVLHRSGEFAFTEDGEVIAQGKIQRLPEGASSKPLTEVRPEDKVESEFLPLNQDDIYKEFRLRGYSYSGVFQGIKSIDNQGKTLIQVRFCGSLHRSLHSYIYMCRTMG